MEKFRSILWKKSNFLFVLILSIAFVTASCGNQTATDKTVTSALGSAEATLSEISEQMSADMETSDAMQIETSEDTTSDNRLIVGTFNIDVKAPEVDVNDQRLLLEEYGVEIFGIQEVDYHLPRHNQELYDPLKDFQKSTYTDSFFGQSVAKGSGGYGNGIVSKYELLEESVTPLVGTGEEFVAPELMTEFLDIYARYDPNSEQSQTELKNVWGADGLVAQGAIEPRSYSRGVFEKNGKKIAFYTTHLSVEDVDIRQQQLQQLKEALDNDPIDYKILTGDFNTDQGINEFNIFTDDYVLANGYEGIWRETMTEKDIARQSLDTSMRVKFLDNIIVTPNIKIEKVEVLKTDLSDHYPLIAELTLD